MASRTSEALEVVVRGVGAEARRRAAPARAGPNRRWRAARRRLRGRDAHGRAHARELHGVAHLVAVAVRRRLKVGRAAAGFARRAGQWHRRTFEEDGRDAAGDLPPLGAGELLRFGGIWARASRCVRLAKVNFRPRSSAHESGESEREFRETECMRDAAVLHCFDVFSHDGGDVRDGSGHVQEGRAHRQEDQEGARRPAEAEERK